MSVNRDQTVTARYAAPIQIRVSEEERSLIEAGARDAGLSMSEFVRRAALRRAGLPFPESNGGSETNA